MRANGNRGLRSAPRGSCSGARRRLRAPSARLGSHLLRSGRGSSRRLSHNPANARDRFPGHARESPFDPPTERGRWRLSGRRRGRRRSPPRARKPKPTRSEKARSAQVFPLSRYRERGKRDVSARQFSRTITRGVRAPAGARRAPSPTPPPPRTPPDARRRPRPGWIASALSVPGAAVSRKSGSPSARGATTAAARGPPPGRRRGGGPGRGPSGRAWGSPPRSRSPTSP